MDGVCSDHDGHLCALLDITNSKQVTNERIVELQHSADFFNTMPKTKIADYLINHIVTKYDSYSIITSPQKGCWYSCSIAKLKWIERELSLKPQEVIFTSDKSVYAKGNVLIDDFKPNITAWERMGGIGIKLKANSKNYTVDDKLQELEERLSFVPYLKRKFVNVQNN